MLSFVMRRFVRPTGDNTSGEVVSEACTQFHILISGTSVLGVELSVLSAMSAAQATLATDVS